MGEEQTGRRMATDGGGAGWHACCALEEKRSTAQTAINILSKQMRCHAEKTNQAKGKDEDAKVRGSRRRWKSWWRTESTGMRPARYRICSWVFCGARFLSRRNNAVDWPMRKEQSRGGVGPRGLFTIHAKPWCVQKKTANNGKRSTWKASPRHEHE